MPEIRCIVLDAMGVIFQAADDVAELLIPFVREAGGCTNPQDVESAYLDASLGVIGPDGFWNRVGLDADVEDDYLARHSLVPGTNEFLQDAQDSGIPVWCLSNDVGRWSRKLRALLNVEALLAGSVISSEVKARKPDSRIYECLLNRSGYNGRDLLFVDDRIKNVEAATAMGIKSLQFSQGFGYRRLAEHVFNGAT